ncbi:hypothetical protein TNCT_623461 [Trichonephila clavata]|uniref:Uncharacterized protein n=1 Tax=Trichonephila clavata TaxID=2740835 RepID=A0A8X6GBD2_TRICU|nr:hypothetical protein TNCT_623461 [Trichonephila clavata]
MKSVLIFTILITFNIQYLNSIDYQNEELSDKTENYDISEETNENQEEIPTLSDDLDEMPASDDNERIEKSLDEDETKSESQNEDASDDEMESKNEKESDAEEEIEPDSEKEYSLEPVSEDEMDKESLYANEDLQNENARYKIIKKRFSEIPKSDEMDFYNKNGNEMDSYHQNRNEMDSYNKKGKEMYSYNQNRNKIDSYNKNGKEMDSYTKNGNEIYPFNKNGKDMDSYIKNENEIDFLNKNKNKMDSYNPNGNEMDSFSKNGNEMDSYSQNKNEMDSYTKNGKEMDPYTKNGKEMDPYTKNGKEMDPYIKNGKEMDSYDQNRNEMDFYTKNGKETDSYFKNGKEMDSHTENGKEIDSYTKNGNKIDFFNKNKKKVDSAKKRKNEIDSNKPKSNEMNSFDKERKNKMDFNKKGKNEIVSNKGKKNKFDFDKEKKSELDFDKEKKNELDFDKEGSNKKDFDKKKRNEIDSEKERKNEISLDQEKEIEMEDFDKERKNEMDSYRRRRNKMKIYKKKGLGFKKYPKKKKKMGKEIKSTNYWQKMKQKKMNAQKKRKTEKIKFPRKRNFLNKKSKIWPQWNRHEKSKNPSKSARSEKIFLSKLCAGPSCVLDRYESRLIKRTINQSDSTNGRNSKRSLIPTESYANLLARDLDSRKRANENIRTLRKRKQVDERGPPNSKIGHITINSHLLISTPNYNATHLTPSSTERGTTKNHSNTEEMHLVKLVYKVKEEELDSIFSNANESFSTSKDQEPLTTPSLDKAVKYQNSMINQMLKAMNNKRKQHLGSPMMNDHHNHSVAPQNRHELTEILQNEKTPSTLVPIPKFVHPISLPFKENIPLSHPKYLKNNTSRSVMLNNFQKSLPQLENLYSILTSHKHGGTPLGTSKAELESSLLNLLKESGALDYLAEEARHSLTTPSAVTPSLLELLEMALFKYADLLMKNEVDNKKEMDKGLEEKVVELEVESEANRTYSTTPENESKFSTKYLYSSNPNTMTAVESGFTTVDKPLNKSARVLAQLSNLYRAIKEKPLTMKNDNSGRRIRDSAVKHEKGVKLPDESTEEMITKDDTDDVSDAPSDNSAEAENLKSLQNHSTDANGGSNSHLKITISTAEDENDDGTDSDEITNTAAIPENSSYEETTT